MKRAVVTLLFAVLAVVAAWSQPKVAVLDSVIPQNMDPSVIVPSTDKIIERLVVSGRFTVLDRANIESVLKEREFQVSGMVSDQDVVTAGKYLGADFVVVAKISKVGDTYFISAKMINIKTGVIANQTSAQGEGKISTLIDLAGQVGEVLSGGAVTAQSSAGDSKDISKPADQPKVKPKEKEVAPPSDRPPLASTFVAGGFLYSNDIYNAKAEYGSSSLTTKYSYDFVGVGATFAIKYLQIGLNIASLTGGDYSLDNTSGSGYHESAKIDAKMTYINLSLLAKLPLRLGGMAFVPMAGIEYDLTGC